VGGTKGALMALTNDVMDAVNIVVGAKAVARKLGVPDAFVEEWMAKGTMKNATREHVVRLSRLPGISSEHLAPLDL
jgi:DNA-binding transcriptional regulator YdaS (Cro superfamily)